MKTGSRGWIGELLKQGSQENVECEKLGKQGERNEKKCNGRS